MFDFKRIYEISLWDDRLTYVDDTGFEYEYTAPTDKNVLTSYFKEIKICTIGAHDMESKAKVCEPKLVRNVNGSNTLTFSLYTKFYDEEVEEFVSNPFVPLLTNERKVKLKYYDKGKLKWLDFLIKEISEDSKNYKNTYTATDLFVNELSKSGLTLEFAQELENNQGTVEELGAAVLQGTDWMIGEDSENIQQLKEEALYEIVLNKNIIATNILTEEKKTIFAGSTIYAFYDSIINKKADFFQFIFNVNNKYTVDDERIIYDADSFYIQTNPFASEEILWPDFAKSVTLSKEYRGERIVRIQKTAYDEALDKYVKVYSDKKNKTVYGYVEPGYVTEQLVQSFITNGEKIISPSGWKQQNKNYLEVQSIPSYQLLPIFSADRISALQYTQSKDNFLLNTGFYNNVEILGNITENERFVFRIKAGFLNEMETGLIPLSDTIINFQVKTYKIDNDGKYLEDDADTKILFNGIIGKDELHDSEGYLTKTFRSMCAVSKQELIDNKYGIFITFISVDNQENATYYIQETQFFREFYDKNGNICLPDGRSLNLETLQIEEKTLSYVEEKFYYYYPGAKTKEEIKYLHIGLENKQFTPQYDFNFQKIRSITASKTNRFDLLQTLSETFECWCRFNVLHKETGEILLGKDYKESWEIYGGQANTQESVFIEAGKSNTKEKILISPYNNYPDYQQLKFITFHKNIGQKNNVDIIYGINLDSIQRKLESESIVSKLIVENNSNEFAPSGSCSISRAKENPIGENFIYDFDYYIKKGILSYNSIYDELYSVNAEKPGYYVVLKRLNIQAQELIEKQIALQTSYDKQDAEKQALKLQYDASIETLRENQEYFYELTSEDYDKISEDNPWMKEKNVIALIQAISNLRLNSIELEKKLAIVEENFSKISSQLNEVTFQLEDIISQKKELISNFEKKYYRFIQEGSWVSEDYIDDELYYLDAESTLHNSSQPKVSYTIKVISVNSIEDYEQYDYQLGDITHIQDTDFFGWTYKNGLKVPYREKIVVTEIETNFDDATKDTFKVQNYRTQFEDLFQRLAAVSQKVEFKTGAYDRAAGLVQTNGNIIPEALKDAFANNSFAISNTKNQSVIWDEFGITTKNILNSDEIVRITSGGIYLTTDGGATWSTGITGQGINAKTITTGQLNTQVVSIFNGDTPSFRWDSLGINAFRQEQDGKYDNSTYVRFDQYGIYGIKNGDIGFTPKTEEEVWNKANFALTWKGFMLKSNDGDGHIEISSENDFNLYGDDKELIRIGRFKDGTDSYGIRIKNNFGIDVFKADQHQLIVGGWTTSEEGFYNKLENLQYPSTKKIGLFAEKQKELYSIFEGKYLPNGEPLKVTSDNWYIVAGNDFGVDREGRLYASNATITGEINATSGRIGDVEIVNGILSIPFDRIGKIEILNKQSQNLFTGIMGTPHVEGSVKIASWVVETDGLFDPISENKITSTGIQTKDKFIAWGTGSGEGGSITIDEIELNKMLKEILTF